MSWYNDEKSSNQFVLFFMTELLLKMQEIVHDGKTYYEYPAIPDATGKNHNQLFTLIKGRYFPHYYGLRGWWATSDGLKAVKFTLQFMSDATVKHTLVNEKDEDMTEYMWVNAVIPITCKTSIRIHTQYPYGSAVREMTIVNLIRQGIATRGVVSALHTSQMTADEANKIAKEEGIMLLRADNETGYWCVRVEKRDRKSPRPYQVEQYFFDKYAHPSARKSFASAAACALSVARALGPLSRIYALNFPEDNDEDILASLRSPTMQNRKQARKKYTPECATCGGPVYTKNSWCSACHAERHKKNSFTWRGQAVYHRGHAMEHTLQRNGVKRSRNGKVSKTNRGHELPEWDTIDDFRIWLADSLESQNFRCYYSNLRLTPKTFSVERLDETKGYSRTNCVLVAGHFQGTFRQWSRDKFLQIPELRQAPSNFDEDEVNRTLQYEETKPKKNPPKLHAFIRRSLYRCANSTEKRKENGRDMQMDISMTDVVQQWVKQRGRCAYLDVPLTFDGDWQMSIERVDDTRGYMVDNIVLIALEVQLRCKWSKELAGKIWPIMS